MKKIILGMVGETGSGKDTFCEYLKKRFKKPVFCFRFSDPLSEALKIFFGEVKKENQQWLAKVLRKKCGNNILGEMMEKRVKRIKNGTIILNGVRVWEEYRMIKNLGGKIIYITADSKIRWQRVRKRGEKKDDSASYRKFLRMEKAKSEILIPEIGKKADFKIENNGSKTLFFQKTRELMTKL